MTATSMLKFVPYTSAFDTGFWHELTRRKLEVFRLDSSDQAIYGFYSNDAADNIPPLFNVDHQCFNDNTAISNQRQQYLVNGTLKLVNTIEEFKTFDVENAMKSQSDSLWKDFTGGQALEQPEKINRFFLLVFADLKKYIYHYWFAFPTFLVPSTFHLLRPVQLLSERFFADDITSITKTLESNRSHACCLFHQSSSFSLISLKQAVDQLNQHPESGAEFFFIVNDPSTDPVHPGWPVRNLLTLLYCHLRSVNQLNVICWREKFRDGQQHVNHSLLLELRPEPIDINSLPATTGWEKNERQRLGPRLVDLSTSMNPVHLAETAVGLNLKLMKWRLAPEIDLEPLEKMRCLLLGAGTLGCNVARCLMGWGVKHITFVDNSRISFSNPVRQTLYTFKDSCENKPKAQAAADALVTIYPGMKSLGVTLTIPMPGHSVGDSTANKVKEDVEHLHELIRQHDVVFLLTDSRESRWLPTLIAAVEQKIVLCCAVGFDSYVIIRHGVPSSTEPSESGSSISQKTFLSGEKLGCYFCNDVVAPGDSSADRTLDQQCTVTRPGISMMASAMCVELLVSIMQHPLRGGCPALIRSDGEESVPETLTCLGIVPHTIRGFLGRYSTVLPTGEAFSQCVACSPKVRNAFQNEGFAFLLNVFNELNYLEDLTGLRAMQLATNLDEIIELSDDEDF